MRSAHAQSPSLLQLATFSTWLVIGTVGGVGIAWVSPPAKMTAESAVAKSVTIDVLTDETVMAGVAPAAATLADAPLAPPAAPVAATPASAIALAVPALIVARAVAPIVTQNAAHEHAVLRSSSIHHLVLGHGEAQFIRLDYPEEAQLNGEQGTIAVQFTQDNDGRVTEVHLTRGSRWPILNQAALKALRQTLFPAGQPGTYDISFDFQLQ